METFVKTENETDDFEEEECNYYDFEDLNNDSALEDPLNLEEIKKEEVFIKEEVTLEEKESNPGNCYENSANIEILGIENTHISCNFDEKKIESFENINLIDCSNGEDSECRKTLYHLDNISALTCSNIIEKSTYSSDFPDLEARRPENHTILQARERRYPCSECYKVFCERWKLTIHMRVHTGEKPYNCSECNKFFSQISHLKRHMRIHTGEKPFKCSDCNKLFSLSTTLKNHMRIHTGVKAFKCSECNKFFSRSSVLKSHMRIHTGEKPFQCSICGKSFSWLISLNRHMRLHNGE